MSNRADEQYLALCSHILETGVDKGDRIRTGVRSVFGYQMRFNLAEGFPLLTTKRVPFRIVSEELLWFLSGSTDVRELVRKDVNIWNKDAYRVYLERTYHDPKFTYEEFVDKLKNADDSIEFDLGPIYSRQWRSWQKAETYYEDGLDTVMLDGNAVVDQIAQAIESIRTNPDSRRHIVSAWNVGELDDMALPPYHTLFQFYVADGKLSCQLYQRSADVFLGLPFNIASYALLTHMVASICDLEVGEFIHTIGDAHIYRNHFDQVREQLTREPRHLPLLNINPHITDIDDFTYEDFEIVSYSPHPPIHGDLSVGGIPSA